MVEITKKDMLDTLSEFYGKFIEPEFRSIHNKLDEHDQKFKDIFEHFDKIYTKLDRLETVYSLLYNLEKAKKSGILYKLGLTDSKPTSPINSINKTNLTNEIGQINHKDEVKQILNK